MSVVSGFFKKLFGKRAGLSDEERAELLAQSPYEISQYHTQGMSLAIFFVLDTRIEGGTSSLPPNNSIKELMAEVGPKGQARAENWVIETLLRPQIDELKKEH